MNDEEMTRPEESGENPKTPQQSQAEAAFWVARLSLAGAAVGGLALLALLFLPGGERRAPGTANLPVAEASGAPAATTSAPAALADASLICQPDLLRACVDRAEFLRGGEGLFVRELPERPITLAHPTDMDMPTREVRSCETYEPLARAGWGGLTSADMRREPVYREICGLKLLITASEPMDKAAPLDSAVWRRLDRGSVPALGEARFSGAAEMALLDQRTVTLAENGLEAKLLYLTTANFDTDPQPEHLIEWWLGVRDGTATASGFALLEMTPDSRAVLRPVDPFDPTFSAVFAGQ
ncbi:MAG: hypothetical protein V2I43_24780 [Parvularcula sp.]|jgi:hypothetical protein|nr:hypothetical protein [Parvularcula sp.]